jgi:hypothetical protein
MRRRSSDQRERARTKAFWWVIRLVLLIALLAFPDGHEQQNEATNRTSVMPVTVPEIFTTNSSRHYITSLVKTYAECVGKERLLEIVSNATRGFPTLKDCQMLPTWSHVALLYGEEPVVYGLDSCKLYRSRLEKSNSSSPKPRVAGLQNTGTNALSRMFSNNLNRLPDYHDYDFMGKHDSVSHLQKRKIAKDELPVVLIRYVNPTIHVHYSCV